MACLSKPTSRREYRAGETVYSTGDRNNGVYCISGGALAVKKSDADGNSVLVHLAYPGETLGYRSFLRRGEHRTSAEAIEPSFVCHIEPETVAQLLDGNPQLGLQFLGHMTRELEGAHDAVMRSSTFSSRERFIHLLLHLVRRHGATFDDGSAALELPLNRRDLASMIGTRPETLSRIITRMEHDGLAEFSGRNVRFHRIDALHAKFDAQLI